ncbi:hypothetical protein RPB_0763 [Rhodopseudomonas palustris HaA2]|uniref:Uncharacterized protein n=1 Tax=Rhodopseudomonas palustris (strain HaA2) TaxID=316058 RepID=Q2J236_RHOP2|nr:hypothetical protein [Rhodopseudomonas palustris]ABD05474.1 hypothetical protein RPB_0763 [Rhodopseudomonas palustris HaA2]
MDVAEFKDLLDRRGDDPAAWPAAERDQADLLLSHSEQARQALAEARLLRAALRSAPVRAPEGLVDRIMSKVRDAAPAPERRDDDPDANNKR